MIVASKSAVIKAAARAATPPPKIEPAPAVVLMNWRRPYGEVWPRGRIWYTQDGMFFNMHGERVEPEPPPVKAAAPGRLDLQRAADLESLHTDSIKVLARRAGLEWTDRETAIDQLARLPQSD